MPENRGEAGGAFDRGVGELPLDSWKAFVDYVHEAMVGLPEFVWRGQRSEHWRVESSLERVLRDLGVRSDSEAGQVLRFTHLERFKLATRGRLDPRDLEERLLESYEVGGNEEGDVNLTLLGPSRAEREENNWWAVGQHYGLKTPLLDWSTSPFVAAFFAFEQATPKGARVGRRCIYGLHRTLVEQKGDELRELGGDEGRTSVIDFVEPLYKDNPRLVSQGGLFTRVPDGMDVREWVRRSYDKASDEGVWLLKITLPDDNREYILRALNRMNINHQSLFPDLYGATEFVNTRLTLERY